MPRNGENYKIKLLKLYEILKNNTDAQHRMTTKEIISRLKEEGISCDRKILYSDIALLNDNDYEVLSVRSQQMEYYVEDRSFDEAEIKILIDAVQAANFITPKKTKELTKKVAELAGSHKAEMLKRNLVCTNQKKSENEFIYYTVDALAAAINSKKKVSFQYFDFNEKKEKIYRKDGASYVENPIDLAIFEDKYYLIVYNEAHNNTIVYRVDKMEHVEVLEEDIVKCNANNANKIRNEAFSMYTGRLETVKISFDKSIIGQILDKFGYNTIIREEDEKLFVNVEVFVSPTFYSWCFIFGPKLSIEGPEKIKLEYATYLKNALFQIEN